MKRPDGGGSTSGPMFLPRFRVKSSFGPQIVMRRASDVGTYVPSVPSVKVQLRLSGLQRKIKRRLEECVCF